MRYPTRFERFINRLYDKIFSFEKIMLVVSIVILIAGMLIKSKYQSFFTFENYVAVVITYLIAMHLFKKFIHVVMDVFNFIFLEPADISKKNDK